MNVVGRTDLERLAHAKEVVAHKFGWERIQDTSTREFYAKDSGGRTLWLKARTGRYRNMSWDGLKSERQYDFLIGILVSPDASTGVSPAANVTLVMRVPKATVEHLKHNRDSDNPRYRWNDEGKAAADILWSDHSSGE